jgi:signal transduction histidine kinase
MGEIGVPDTCRVVDAIDHVRALLGAQKLFDGVALTVDVDTGAAVTMSRDDLTQLLVNLLLNAAQALGGKGAISVSAEAVGDWRPALGVVSRRALRLSVTDDGPGVPAEIADRIFDPFFTTKPEGRGAGLGLAICQSICDRVGAEITLDTAHAQGARFIVSLPLA